MSKFSPPPNAIIEHGVKQGGDRSQDRMLGEQTIYGPISGQDVRMYLDRASLEQMLDVAKSSLVGRVVLEGVGARVRVWEDTNGHRYITWQLISHPPKAESAPFKL